MQRPLTNHSQKINEQIRRQLLPRTDKLKQIISLDLLPESNEKTVIIPCLQKTLGFKTNQYGMNKGYLEGYISRLDFNGFVRKCNKIVEDEVIKKTKKQNEPFFSIISTLLKISIVIAIMTFFLMATIVFWDLQSQTQQTIQILAGVLLASSSFIAAICPVVIYNSKYEVVNYEEAIKEQLETLTQQENTSLQNNEESHLKWKIQKNFFWIQLHIDREMFERIEKKVDRVEEINDEDDSQASGNNFLRRKDQKSGNNFRKDELVHDA